MGSYKIGSECCNNCIHWDAERDDKHGKENVFSYKNCAKCTSSHGPRKGLNTLSSNVCPYFSHIWGITKTFEVQESNSSTSSNPFSGMIAGLDEPSRAYMQAIFDYRMESASISRTAKSVSEPEPEEEEDDLDDEAEREFARSMAELGKANDRASELVAAGMDIGYVFKDEAVEFMHLFDRAKGGDAKAQFALARAFWNGTHGCKKEDESSDCGNGWKWCNESADNDYGFAQLWKGVSWRNDAAKSHDVNDYEKSIKWLERALRHSEVRDADRRNDFLYSRALNTSRIALGVKYLYGKDVDTDYETAISYFSAAEDAGDSKGADYKKKAAEFHESVAESFRNLKEASGDSVELLNILGMVYAGFKKYAHYRLVVKKDHKEAVECFRKAAKGFCVDAMDNLGLCYQRGDGVTKDAVKAAEWFRNAAEYDSRSAQYHYANCLWKGDGVEKKEKEAVSWYIKAAASGSVQSLKKLASFAENGRGMNEDPQMSFTWYKLAAEAGDAESMYELGRLYKKGYGCDVDESLGADWQKRAEEKGYEGGW